MTLHDELTDTDYNITDFNTSIDFPSGRTFTLSWAGGVNFTSVVFANNFGGLFCVNGVQLELDDSQGWLYEDVTSPFSIEVVCGECP